ncbi:MAG TPA: hypothetical protein VGA88_06595 [Burkholderiales bacterium]
MLQEVGVEIPYTLLPSEGVDELVDVLRRACDDRSGRKQFAQRRLDWARQRAGWPMLSRSS